MQQAYSKNTIIFKTIPMPSILLLNRQNLIKVQYIFKVHHCKCIMHRYFIALYLLTGESGLIMQYTKNSKPYTLTILMCTICIDVMGFGLILPIFPSLFLTSGCTFSGFSSHISYFLYGLAFALWPAGAFLGTPFLGLYSDKTGRRNILSACLLLNGISYLVCGFSIMHHNIWLFLISRFVAGFFGGSYDIAQAGVADISLPENKARNMGLITFAVAIGVILGPAISGFTTNSRLISWFSITTPFWISSILAVINATFIIMFFEDNFVPDKTIKIKITQIFSSFTFVFKDKRIIDLGMAFLFLGIAWGMYISAMPLLLTKLFNANIQSTGLFFCIIGLGNSLTILYLQKRMLKLFSLIDISFIFSVLLIALFIILTIFFNNEIFEYTAAFLMAVFELLLYSSILAMCSNAVETHEQGRIMGGLGAIASISFFISGIATSALLEYSLKTPMIIITASYLLCIFFVVKVKYSKSKFDYNTEEA